MDAKIFLKEKTSTNRAYKINALGQVLLHRMGKRRSSQNIGAGHTVLQRQRLLYLIWNALIHGEEEVKRQHLMSFDGNCWAQGSIATDVMRVLAMQYVFVRVANAEDNFTISWFRLRTSSIPQKLSVIFSVIGREATPIGRAK